MKLKFRNLKASEIKPAIAKVTNEGVMLLLWKNNFVDLDILDEVLEATDYQVTYPKENVCCISIWDKLKKTWVSKEGIGEGPSAKCMANDSLKRAGMSWGIGRELFTCGELFVPKKILKNWKEPTQFQYRCYDEFKVLDIQYVDNTIVYLKLGIYSHGEHYDDVSFSFEEPEEIKAITKKARTSSKTKSTVEEKNESPAEPEVVEDVTKSTGDVVENEKHSEETVDATGKDAAIEQETTKVTTEDVAESPVEQKTEKGSEKASSKKNDKAVAILDDEIILMGNCRGKRFGDVKNTDTFKSFLEWAKKSSPRYSDVAASEQFLKFKALASISA